MKNNQQKIKFKEIGQFEDTRLEMVHNEIFTSSKEGSVMVAREIADLIIDKQSRDEHCVLGLATGSSPIKVYEELIRLHKEEGLSFKNVVTFNLDEYVGLKKENPQSYHYFMHQYLFDHIDIDPKNINIPNGIVDNSEIYQYCVDYEMRIKDVGGLDFQLLGIGRTGHIGFNEPGSHINSGTRIIQLDNLTRVDAASDFNGKENVPTTAITMGIGTILKAKRIVLLSWGQKKSSITRQSIEGDITASIPATYLQHHKNTTFVLDEEAASEITRINTPWLVSNCIWTKNLSKKAVYWLAQNVKKPILKLTERDYNEHGMSNLITQEGSAYDLNIKMFNNLQHTITGWPGGKPNSDDINRPERATPSRKRVIIFSPHPDDDVISMGGTFDRLVTQGHDVHVVYQTSGNIAVDDKEALKFCEVADDTFIGKSSRIKEMIDFINTKEPNSKDSLSIRELKGNIRKRESYTATRYVGISDKNVHFLDLPFYETGEIKKNPLGQEDINIIIDKIKEIKPHQIYAAGDLADPHGTHKVCLDGIFEALENIKTEDYMKDCYVWLYRGAWHEWDIHEIEMSVPMSPLQVNKKRTAILFHQSQKDRVMFQGEDEREFWMRAEDRNKTTAELYNKLGMAEYEAMEAFRRYHFL